MTVLYALLCTLIGLTLVFAGFRLARIMIPLWGFLGGLSLGGAVVAALSDAPFLATTLGIMTGLVAGVVFALLAYLYYGAAVVVAAGLLGYWLGSSFIQLFGIDPGFLSTVTGLVLGVVFGFVALMANAPKYVLIVLTAVAGAVSSIGGILLLFGVIPLDYFNYAVAHAAISNSFYWSVLAIALSIVGMVWQTRSTDNFTFAKWAIGEDRDHHLPSGTHTPSWGAR